MEVVVPVGAQLREESIGALKIINGNDFLIGRSLIKDLHAHCAWQPPLGSRAQPTGSSHAGLGGAQGISMALNRLALLAGRPGRLWNMHLIKPRYIVFPYRQPR